MTQQAHMWFQTFGQTRKGGEISPCESLDALQMMLQKRGSRGVIVYMRPVQVVAEAMHPMYRGAGVSQALEAWCEAAQNILNIQSRQRSRVVLLEQSDSLDAPSDPAVIKALAGMALPAAPGPKPQHDLSAYETVAKLALGLDPRARDMLDMLQAATTGTYEDLAQPFDQIEALLPPLQEIDQLKRKTELQDRAHQESAAKYEACKAALAAAQADRDAQAKTHAQAQSKAEALWALASDQLAACKTALKEAEADRDAQAKTHVQAQSKAEALWALASDQLAACKTALKEAEATSKATAKARRKAEAEARDQQQASAQKNHVLAQQVQGLEDHCRAATQRLEAKEKDLAALTKAHEATKAALAAQKHETVRETQLRQILEDQVVGLQQPLLQSEAARQQCLAEKHQLDAYYRERVCDLGGMLDAVHQSTSWRLTGPARSVMRRIRR